MVNTQLFYRSVKMMIALTSILGTLAAANEYPNLCSRDQNENEFTIISYHEIADKSETLDPTYTVSPSNFNQQIHWLMEDGYHFVNVDDIINYRKNHKPLPNNAVLITFDDGYQSVYANAYPILKKYRIPFVIALVGVWQQAEDQVSYGGQMISRDKFLSQQEIKEMVSSGLAEVASHSFNSHNGIIGNPQGNMEAALTTRAWFADKQRYEDEKSYRLRIYYDLLENNTFLEAYTGQKPRIIVWPYGHYNKETRRVAERLGMPIGLTLDDGSNTLKTPLWGLRRILVEGKMTHRDLKLNMWMRNANFTDDARATKAVRIDLDDIYDPDSAQQEKKLALLIERIKQLGINTVYIQAFADTDADKVANAVYFPNRNMPIRADLFNRVAWQISTCTQVRRVYAWMPILAWQLPKEHNAAQDIVVASQNVSNQYPRLSPFSARARKVIGELYEDLAKSTYIDGILFQDEVTLGDFEDDSTFAHQQYKKWGLYESVKKIRENRKQFEKWTKLKTRYLDDFSMRLAQIIRNEQPGLLTARSLNMQVALDKDVQEWDKNILSDSISHYDYTLLTTMPDLAETRDPNNFYGHIFERVKKEKCGLERTVMELRTINGTNDQSISPLEVGEAIQYFYDLGINHIAYYPDDILKNQPDAQTIQKAFAHKPLRMDVLPNQ